MSGCHEIKQDNACQLIGKGAADGRQEVRRSHGPLSPICKIINSLNEHLLSPYGVPGFGHSTRHAEVTEKNKELTFCWKETK